MGTWSGQIIELPRRTSYEPWLSKTQLAAILSYSRRWVEIQTSQGAPSRKLPNGQRRYRLSDFSRWLDEKRTEMTVYRRGDAWVGTFQHRGERIWIGSHPTKKAALAAEQRMRRDLNGLSPETFEGWARRWLRDYARPGARTRLTYRYAVERLIAEFGPRPLSSIDRMEARAAAQRLPRQPVKIARAMLNDAIDAGVDPRQSLRGPSARTVPRSQGPGGDDRGRGRGTRRRFPSRLR
jgi:hypothetical protein